MYSCFTPTLLLLLLLCVCVYVCVCISPALRIIYIIYMKYVDVLYSCFTYHVYYLFSSFNFIYIYINYMYLYIYPYICTYITSIYIDIHISLCYSCFIPASYIICVHNMFYIYICESWHAMARWTAVYAPRGHHHTTPTDMHQYTDWSMLLYSALLLLLSCFPPALSIIELSFCFIYTPALLLLYSYFVTVVILFY